MSEPSDRPQGVAGLSEQLITGNRGHRRSSRHGVIRPQQYIQSGVMTEGGMSASSVLRKMRERQELQLAAALSRADRPMAAA